MTSPWPLVLMYHGITAGGDGVDINALGILNQYAFARHLELLKKHFLVMHPEEFIERLVGNRIFPKNSVVVTLDDGFQNTLDAALPIAESLEVPLLVFVSTGHLDHREWLWFSRYRAHQLIHGHKLRKNLSDLLRLPLAEIEQELDRMGAPKRAGSSNQMHRFFDGIDSEDLKRAVGNGFLTVGGHTVRHPILMNELPEVQVQEIGMNKMELESIINAPVRLFAYPNGYYNDAVARLVKDAGYAGAFVANAVDVHRSDGLSAFKIPRTGINRESSAYLWWRVLRVGSSIRKAARVNPRY